MFAPARALLADAARSYSRHNGRMLASAVAFSALLSIAPLLMIALGVASAAVGNDASRATVMDDLARWIGADSAATIFALLERASDERRSGLASILGALVLVYASTRLFSQMKRALNHLWNIQSRSARGWRGKVGAQLRKRGLALVMVLFVGLLIIASVAAKTVLIASTHPLGDSAAHGFLHGGELVLSLTTTTLMFAALFKLLPDARLAWRDAWRGALVTAVLFSLGTTLIGLYLGRNTLDVLYGPGGSLVLLLLWVQYSAQVFFYGAAVTGELARRRGRPIEPDEDGVRVAILDT